MRKFQGKKIQLYKLVVLGDGGSGKTELAVRFTLNYFTDSYDPSIEDSYRKQIVVDGEDCMVEVLDTAGQEEYTALRDQWITEGEGFLVAYSITSRSTFTQASKFFNLVKRVKGTGSQNQSEAPGGPMPVIMLVGNHSEQIQEREVSTQEGIELAKNLGCEFVEVSTKNDINVDKAFVDVVRLLRKQRSSSA